MSGWDFTVSRLSMVFQTYENWVVDRHCFLIIQDGPQKFGKMNNGSIICLNTSALVGDHQIQFNCTVRDIND